MSLLDRFQTVLRSNLNALVGAAEDPEKLIAQTILDMQAEVKRARAEIITALGTSKRLAKKAEETRAEVDAWEQKALLALKHDDDDLAREALRRKARIAKDVETFERQSAEQAQAAAEMQEALAKIEARISDLEARKVSLASQVRRARAGSADPLAPSTSTHGTAIGSLDRMLDRIDQMEAEVEAHGIFHDPKRAVVESELRALERNQGDTAVDDELAALKRKLEG